MDDLAILKAAYHMDDGIHFPDMGEELVSKAFAIGSAPHQTCNVYKFDGGRGNLIRIIHFSQLVQTLIRNCNHTHIGFDGAEGIVGSLRTGIGDRIEQCAFAHIGQTHDSKFHVLSSKTAAPLPRRNQLCRIFHPLL